jgi:hypothetical protein
MTIVRQRILAAFLPRNELLAQTQFLAAIEDPSLKAQFWANYKIARSRLLSLQPLQAAPPAIEPLPQSAGAHLSEVESSDAFQEGFGGLEYRFLSVPIDRITPVQIFSNVEPELRPPPAEDLDALLDYALPADPRVPGEAMIIPTGVRFTTPRYGINIQHVRRRVHDGRVILSLEHPNLVQIRRFGNVLLLANGTHRCMEMARAGYTHIPAIVIEHQNPAEFEGPIGPGFWNPQFLFANARQPAQGARLPVIPDLLTDLAVECRVSVVPSVIDVPIGAPQPTQVPTGQPFAIQLGGLIPQRLP